MLADTQLTEKYFDCITFKYASYSDKNQECTMFAPTLVFDRNSNNVPFFVRLVDMCWYYMHDFICVYDRSIGIMSNFQLPVKFPCAVYTIAMMMAENGSSAFLQSYFSGILGCGTACDWRRFAHGAQMLDTASYEY